MKTPTHVHSFPRLGCLAALLGCLLAAQPASAQQQFFDESYQAQSTTSPDNRYIGQPWLNEYGMWVNYTNNPLSVVWRGNNAMTQAAIDADVAKMPRLDWGLHDCESPMAGYTGTTEDQHAISVGLNLDRVLNSIIARSQTSAAKQGNYGFCVRTPAYSEPNGNINRYQQTDTEYLNRVSNGTLDVAMPITYFYDYYSNFSWNGTDTSGGPGATSLGNCPIPNAAMFWAPLEFHSQAARNLPAGQLLIPFLSGFVNSGSYADYIPTSATIHAMTKHVRMRKAYSFNLWGTAASERANYVNDWDALNGYFNASFTTHFYNLDTLKPVQVYNQQWSAVRYRNNVLMLAANFDAPGHNISWPPYTGLSGIAGTTTTHSTFTTTIADVTGNSNFNTTNSPWGNPWDSSNGNGGGGCIKMSGAFYQGGYGSYIATEPSSKMVMTFKAKAVGGPAGAKMYIGNYCRTVPSGSPIYGLYPSISSGSYPTGIPLTSTYQTFTCNFTLPNDARIGYISPLLYNGYGGVANDPATTVYIDDVVINWQ